MLEEMFILKCFVIVTSHLFGRGGFIEMLYIRCHVYVGSRPICLDEMLVSRELSSAIGLDKALLQKFFVMVSSYRQSHLFFIQNINVAFCSMIPTYSHAGVRS